MTDQAPDISGADTDVPDETAAYDPDEDQDTEPSTMDPAGGAPTRPPSDS